ncbi:hypothetical protein CN096_23755 [Sinorhizobium meliloti]|nr:hypothetical protein CN089_22905 [Sinorhizobium meliloti]RVQ06428.1 hypothetical protein CN096_23755 [Sinorhizobium meliloti]
MPARFSQLRVKLGLAPEALSRASSAVRHGVTSFGESRPRRLRLADLLTTSRADGGNHVPCPGAPNHKSRCVSAKDRLKP